MQRQVDALWASYPPAGSLWSSDRLAVRHGLPWIADMRDALTVGWMTHYARHIVARQRVRRLLRRAARVVEVSPPHARRDEAWLGRPCETITSGFDPQLWASVDTGGPRPPRKYLEVVCAGKMLDGYLTLASALPGFRRLLASDPQARVQIVYYGRSTDLVTKAAAEAGLSHIVDCRGFISPEELRARLAAADALLLPTNAAGLSGVPGGKLYEYLAARRPILAVPGHDEFVAGVLNETAAGVSATSAEEITQILSAWLAEWRTQGEVAYRGNSEAVDRFSIREGTHRLGSLLDAAVEARAPSPRATRV